MNKNQEVYSLHGADAVFVAENFFHSSSGITYWSGDSTKKQKTADGGVADVRNKQTQTENNQT